MIIRDAIFSTDKTRRYWLTRLWNPLAQDKYANLLGWGMLNPSKADDLTDDATVRKCVGFGKRWGFSGILIVNLIPIISTDPYNLPPWNGLFPDNEAFIKEALKISTLFVVAWGAVNRDVARTVAWAEHVHRFRELATRNLYCIGRTKNGSPLHPSRTAYVDFPEKWEWE